MKKASNSLELNIYNKKGEVTKTAKAQTVDIEFGTIRKLMELVRIDNIEDTAELLNVIWGAWDEITNILGECFPDMEQGDWDHVKVKELIPLVVQIFRFAFAEMLTIPQEKN